MKISKVTLLFKLSKDSNKTIHRINIYERMQKFERYLIYVFDVV